MLINNDKTTLQISARLQRTNNNRLNKKGRINENKHKLGIKKI